jgi:hypothetical protein
VGFCTSSPQQGVKYQLWYLNFVLYSWMTHQYENYRNYVVICRVGNIPEHGTSLHIQVDIWHPALGNIFDWKPKWARTLSSDHLGYKSKVFPGNLTDLSAWVGFCTSSPQQGVKYQLWYLNFVLWRGGGLYKYHGTSLHIQVDIWHPALGNIFDWKPKWARTLSSLIYASWDIYRDPHPSTKQNSNIKVDIILRTAKFLTTWGLIQRYCPGL